MGAPRRISHEAIVTTALAIVDEEGLARLTARSLADRLGVKASSLYYHFRDMDEIAVEVGFQAIQRTNTARPAEQLATWQDAARAFVEEYRNSLLEHPNVLPLLVGPLAARIQARQLVGLGEGIDFFIGLLEADGIRGDEALIVIDTVEAFTIGTVAMSAQSSPDVPVVGGSVSLALLRGRTRITDDDRFRRGVEALLEGLAATARRTSGRVRTKSKTVG
jgi:AcrR family transcriptional regulator